MQLLPAIGARAVAVSADEAEASSVPFPGPRRAAFTFIDLFSGIGGFRLAFQGERGRCLFSSEIDRWARATYRANYGEEPVGDINAVDPADIPDHDVLLGGFPCQPFSIAGVSKYASLGRAHGFLDQTKGTLFFRVARILQEKQPRAFVLENVKNLLSHDRGRTWETIRATLIELGYHVDHRVLDARAVVPQHRERVFIVGFRRAEDAAAFSWPTLPADGPRIGSVLEPDPDPRYTLSDKLWGYLRGYAEKHRAAGNGFGFGLVGPKDVSRTLSARYFKDGSEILVANSGGNPRRLTPRECARLMGYPDEFVIPVSDTQAYKQFGNSVVPKLVRLLAREVAEVVRAPAQVQTGLFDGARVR